MPSTTSRFKGRPTISLKQSADTPDMYAFTFGVAKAKLILDNIEAISKFVQLHQTDETAPTQPKEAA